MRPGSRSQGRLCCGKCDCVPIDPGRSPGANAHKLRVLILTGTSQLVVSTPAAVNGQDEDVRVQSAAFAPLL